MIPKKAFQRVLLIVAILAFAALACNLPNGSSQQQGNLVIGQTAQPTEVVPPEWNNFQGVFTKVGDSYTTINNWIITVKEFKDTEVLLSAQYGNEPEISFSLQYDGAAWSGGDRTVRLVARDDPELGKFVERWLHVVATATPNP